MGIKDARKAATKKRTCGSSVAMAAEMPPHGAIHVHPPRPLPPGVYFSPSREECLGLLNRSIAGDKELRDARGHIARADVYGESPNVLRQRHLPASIRDREQTWWFLSQTRFQSQTEGGGASKRADRQVTAGGYWRLEQSRVKLDNDGYKNTFGYYVGLDKTRDKTAWLMQEFTSTNDDGKGKRGVPALYRVYVTPRATDEQLSDLFGEDGVKHWPDGTKKPARHMVREDYFDRIAELLPEGSVRGEVVQEHVQAPPPPPPAPPEGLLDYYGQQEHYLGQYDQQQGQPPPLPPVAPEGLVGFYTQQGQYLGQYEQQQQQGQYLGHYEQHQQQGQYLGHYEQQQQPGQYLGQYQYQQDLGQYEQQQEEEEPLSMVAPPLPPPASPSQLAADAPSDNLRMSMADFMRIINDNEQPAETAKGGEPNWDALDVIVDDDELASFNKEG